MNSETSPWPHQKYIHGRRRGWVDGGEQGSTAERKAGRKEGRKEGRQEARKNQLHLSCDTK